VASGTTDKQRVVRGTLASIAGIANKADMKPPAVIVIGKVAGLDHLEWFG
jgi:siroheme synthase